MPPTDHPHPRDAPAFDFYPERWLVGTAAMTDLEQIAYLRLLCHQWMSGDTGLPEDPATLRRLAGKGVTPAVLAKFPAGPDARLRNARLETIRREQRDRIRKKAEQRRAAAHKRWHPETHACGHSHPKTSETDVDAYANADSYDHVHGDANAGANAELMRPHPDRIAEDPAEAMPSLCGSHAHHPPPTTHPDEKRASLARIRASEPWPSLDEVKAYAAETLLASADCAERFWNDCEGAGWVNRHGQPIRHWQPLLRNFVASWKAQESRRKTATQAQATSSVKATPKPKAAPVAQSLPSRPPAHRPRHAAYNAQTAITGLSAADIGTFCPGQR